MSEFWKWFAECLKNVADRAYHRGWHDRSFIADNPESQLPGEDWHRNAYTNSGFEPEYVAAIYELPSFGFTHEDVALLRRQAEELRDMTTLALVPGALPEVTIFRDAGKLDALADRIEAPLPKSLP